MGAPVPLNYPVFPPGEMEAQIKSPPRFSPAMTSGGEACGILYALNAPSRGKTNNLIKDHLAEPLMIAMCTHANCTHVPLQTNMRLHARAAKRVPARFSLEWIWIPHMFDPETPQNVRFGPILHRTSWRFEGTSGSSEDKPGKLQMRSGPHAGFAV